VAVVVVFEDSREVEEEDAFKAYPKVERIFDEKSSEG
jgi:hypothetical protein